MRTQSVGFMKGETQRLVRLTDSVLDLGKLEASSLDRRAVHLIPLLNDVVAQVRRRVTAYPRKIIPAAG